MKKAIITTTIDLTEGGCNSCGVTKCTTYTLMLDEQEINVDELTVNALVQAIVIKNGWRPELEMDLLGDYLVFKKAAQEVLLKENFQGWLYEKNGQEVSVADDQKEEQLIFESTNEVLQKCFDLEPLAFER